MIAGQPGQLDAVVIGGGPAGATTATLLAMAGHRVSVIEKGHFPRHHVGESLMPETFHTFQRLGMLEKLEQSDFPRKESVQFVTANGKDSTPFYFTDWNPAASSRTWQVRRDEFDRMMLDNAAEHGVEVRYGTRVIEILFDGETAIGVRVEQDGQQATLPARVVVDASGTAAILSRQLKLRYPDERLHNGAIYTYFRNAERDRGRNAGATIILHTPDRQGWFWFIPISDEITSVGLVSTPAYLFAGRGDDPTATLEEEINACPGLARRLAGAERTSSAFVTSDFSYRSRQLSGPGWVLVGDAFGFLDPVYSSGVMLALKSGEWAADAIHDALDAGDVSGERLGRFGAEFVKGMQSIRQLVYAFYDPAFSVGRFAADHPEYREHLIRILVGDVFNDEVGQVFDEIGRRIDLPGPIEMPLPVPK